MFQFLMILWGKRFGDVGSTTVLRNQKWNCRIKTFRPDSTIYFRHAFLIFDLNEKKQRTEFSWKKIFNFFMGKLEGNFFVVSMIFKFFLSFLCLCEEARVKLMGKSELRNVEQTHNQAGEHGMAANKELIGGIWDFVVRFCSRLLASQKGFLLDGLMHGKIFRLRPVKENDS